MRSLIGIPFFDILIPRSLHRQKVDGISIIVIAGLGGTYKLANRADIS
jgi:hypothetical protein